MTVESGPEPEETKTLRLITWKPFFEALKEKRLLPDPDHTSRITIDAKVGEPCTITVYTYADQRLVEVVDSLEEAAEPHDSIVR